MNCERVQQLIAADSETNEQTTREWESHVAACRECAEHATELSDAREWLRRFRREPIDESVYRELRASVMEEVNRREAASGGWNWMWSVFGWKTAAAALTVSCIVIGLIGAEYARISSPPLVSPRIELPAIPPVQEWTKTWKPRAASEKPYGGKKPPNVTAPSWFELSELIASALPAAYPKTGLEDFVPGESLKDFSPATNTTRIEIATADPSIRIIWFAPDKQ